MAGSTLPPGCNASDIPGNRPEDEKWDEILENFWNGKYCSDEQFEQFCKAGLDSALIDIVDEAIEYGMDLGREEQRMIEEENRFYAQYESRIGDWND